MGKPGYCKCNNCSTFDCDDCNTCDICMVTTGCGGESETKEPIIDENKIGGYNEN